MDVIYITLQYEIKKWPMLYRTGGHGEGEECSGDEKYSCFHWELNWTEFGFEIKIIHQWNYQRYYLKFWNHIFSFFLLFLKIKNPPVPLFNITQVKYRTRKCIHFRDCLFDVNERLLSNFCTFQRHVKKNVISTICRDNDRNKSLNSSL